MANELIYNVKVNGIDVATQEVDALNESVGNLGNTFAEIGGEVNLTDFNQQLETTGENVEDLGNQLDDLGSKPIELPTDGLKKFDNQTSVTTEKIDKLSSAGEKGFKGLSDALRLFGVDTTILDNIKDSLGALGDLLDSQSKITDVAFDSKPIVEQAKSIKGLEEAQKASTLATEAGAAATTTAGTAAKGASVATRVFSAALNALPWFAVIAGITAIVAIVANWKKEQESTVKSFEDGLKELGDRIDETKNRYGNLVTSIKQNASVQQTQNQNILSTLNAQLQLLESQGASAEKIAAQKKLILQAEQQLLQTNIDTGNKVIQQTQQTLEIQKGNLKQTRDDIALKEEALRLGLAGSKTDEEKKKKQDEINQLKDKEKTIQNEINGLNSTLSNTQNEISTSQNDLVIKQQFGLKIINAQTAAEKEKLRIQEQQAKIALEENQRKLNDEILKGKKSLEDFNEEYRKLIKGLEDSIEQNQFELQIQLGDVSGVVDRLKSTLNSIPEEIEIEKKDIEDKLSKPIIDAINEASGLVENGIELLRTNIDLITKDSSEKLDKFFAKTKSDVSGLEIKIKESKSLEESQQKISEFIEKLKSDLNQEFKLGNISPEEFQRLNGVIDGINGSLTTFAQKQNELKGISGSPLANQEASAKVLLKTFKDLNDIIGKSSNTIENNFNNVIEGVNDDIDAFQNNLEGAGIGKLFQNLISKEDADKLKEKVKKGVQDAKDEIDKEKINIEDLFTKLKTDNPELADALEKIKQQLLTGLDKLKKDIDDKGAQTTKAIENSFSDGLIKTIEKLEKWAAKVGDILTAVGDLETQLLENQANKLEEYYENRNEVIENQLQLEQEFQDRQAQIVSDSQTRLNDLENQLQNARGSRAAFLQKLRAEEQSRLQKAEAERIAAANRQKKLEEEQKKLEAQRAADLEAIEKRKFEIQKRSNIAQIIVNTALAFSQQLRQPPGPPATVPLAVAIAALGAVQLATAASAKFAKGGLLEGPSHKEGGIPIMVNGGRLVEAEGGEYIINKKSTSTNFNLLKKINENPDVKFQNGGMVPSSTRLSTAITSGRISPASIDNKQNLDAILTTINDNLSNISVQASIQDIRDANAVNMQIEDLRRI